MKKQYLSISEMAKLRNMTIETLRHYDRIGLIKPDYVDKNNIRYYEAVKSEKLRTIQELKELGMSLKEIKEYFDNRTVATSFKLLKEKKDYIEKQLNFYKEMNYLINEKITGLEELLKTAEFGVVYEKIIPDRYYIEDTEYMTNETEFAYSAMRLENRAEKLKGFLQVYGMQSYGGFFDIQNGHVRGKLLMFMDKNSETSVLRGGKYLCVMKTGSYWKIEPQQKLILDYAAKKGYTIEEPFIGNARIHYPLSDIIEERVCEFQVRIKD